MNIQSEIHIKPRAVAIGNNGHFARWLVYVSIFLLGLDTIYRFTYGITYQSRGKCILFTTLPRWAFVVYENVIELALIVLLGIFIAALIEKYFLRVKKIVPANPVLAFVYASIIPVCACGVVPLINASKRDIPFYTIITFVVAAPLLNPYIIALSVSILGIEYTLLRIAASLILAVTVGYIVHLARLRMGNPEIGIPVTCRPSGDCSRPEADIFTTTLQIFKKVLPFLLIAAALSIAMELFSLDKIIKHYDFSSNFLGTVLVIAIGVPVYFCNGADVLFLQPLMQQGNLPMGIAVAFSLTSTSVCITSLALLVKYIGKKLTLVLLAGVVFCTIVISLLITIMTSLIGPL